MSRTSAAAVSDLDVSTQYWYSVSNLAERWHISEPMVHLILKPHRGRCHLGRRGRHPRLTLWIPVEVVRKLDRERKALERVVKPKPCQDPV